MLLQNWIYIYITEIVHLDIVYTLLPLYNCILLVILVHFVECGIILALDGNRSSSANGCLRNINFARLEIVELSDLF
jgi:hypothetical protein